MISGFRSDAARHNKASEVFMIYLLWHIKAVEADWMAGVAGIAEIDCASAQISGECGLPASGDKIGEGFNLDQFVAGPCDIEAKCATLQAKASVIDLDRRIP